METSGMPNVLLVEDEPSLRFLTSDFLSLESGFTVIEARTADEAVEILKSRADIHCVFTDVRMPGRLNGLDLTRHVNAQYPGLPVIMTSGNLHPNEKMADVPFMSKPYDLPTLAVTIRGLIDQLSQKDR